jgi:hypothetical protein
MEVARPLVDAYLLSWIARQPLRKEWFFEQRDGNCRLMATLAQQLSQTSDLWERAIAPAAEWISHTLWSALPKPSRQLFPATRLTQDRRREARGVNRIATEETPAEVPHLCRTCGDPLWRGKRECASCARVSSKANLIEAAKLGRVATHSPKAEALRAATQRRHAKERAEWNPTDNPVWLSAQNYRKKVQPFLGAVTAPAISRSLRISEPYAADIRLGKRVPHPRHWKKLAILANVFPTDKQSGKSGPSQVEK